MNKALSALFVCLLTTGCFSCANEDPQYTAGRQLALNYCANCHAFPEPELLTKEIWVNEILPKMGAYFGHYGQQSRGHYLGKEQERKYLSNLYPTEVTMDSADWAAIQTFYLDFAATSLDADKVVPQIMPMDRFRKMEVFDTAALDEHALTTMIKFNAGDRSVAVGGKVSSGGQLVLFNASGIPTARWLTATTPSDWDKENNLILEMGSLSPSDDPQGTLTPARVNPDTGLLSGLARPVQMTRVDLNQDGNRELIFAEYGNLVGKVSRYELTDEGVPDPEKPPLILAQTPGAIRLRVADLDADGHDDLLVLFAQGDERVEAYYSRSGKPERKRLLRFPPSYGSSDIEIVDFDRDGDLDIVYTNGDNFDYRPIPKAYHGVRIFDNDGEGNFTETWFASIDGAYDVEVADFDLDGDNDIAVIAYFVPPDRRRFASFVYLEQRDELEFYLTGFLKEPNQHYLAMTSGDVDQDGDQDLLIGNFSGYLPDSKSYNQRSAVRQPLYFKLENLTR